MPRKSKTLLLAVFSSSLLDVLAAEKGKSTNCPYLKSSAVMLSLQSPAQIYISDTANTVWPLHRQIPAQIPTWLKEKFPLAAHLCNSWSQLQKQGRGFT